MSRNTEPGVGCTTLSVAVPRPIVMLLPLESLPVSGLPGSVGSFQPIATPTPARSVLQSEWWVVQRQPGSLTGSVPPEIVSVRDPSGLVTSVPCVAAGTGSGASAYAGATARPSTPTVSASTTRRM